MLYHSCTRWQWARRLQSGSTMACALCSRRSSTWSITRGASSMVWAAGTLASRSTRRTPSRSTKLHPLRYSKTSSVHLRFRTQSATQASWPLFKLHFKLQPSLTKTRRSTRALTSCQLSRRLQPATSLSSSSSPTTQASAATLRLTISNSGQPETFGCIQLSRSICLLRSRFTTRLSLQGLAAATYVDSTIRWLHARSGIQLCTFTKALIAAQHNTQHGRRQTTLHFRELLTSLLTSQALSILVPWRHRVPGIWQFLTNTKNLIITGSRRRKGLM